MFGSLRRQLDWTLDEPTADGERALSIVLPKRPPPGGGTGGGGARGPIFASLRVCGDESDVPGLVAGAD